MTTTQWEVLHRHTQKMLGSIKRMREPQEARSQNRTVWDRGLRVGRAGYQGLGRSRRGAAWRWRLVDMGIPRKVGHHDQGLEEAWNYSCG